MSVQKEEVDVGVHMVKFEEPNGEPTCKIIFENSQNRVYYIGQVVHGCVNLTINEAITVKAIYANVLGRGYCSWSQSASKSRTSTHMKEEFYINRKFYYVGSRNTSNRTTVQPGEYKYLFNCDIPDDCHTSVEENTGFIRYSVTVVIEEDLDKKKEFEESFTVINPLNLNDERTYSYPLSDEFEDTFNKYSCWLCCWQTEPVKISVRVPMRGYVPGQAIEITINVDNKSNQKYDNFTSNIFKNIEFYANERTTSNREELTTAKCDGCEAGETISRKLIITVPPTPRTETSNICSISYELTVEASTDICRDSFKMTFPITIGSYPILNTRTDGIVVTQQPTAGLLSEEEMRQEQLHSEIINAPTQSQPLLVNENLPPQPGTSSAGQPTIKSPVFQVGESNRSDKDLEKSYRPLYPVYANSRFPLACTLTVEAEEMKPIKM